MKKSILTVLTGVVLMVSGGHAQAEELNIVPHKGMTGELRDGMKIATGRIICREAHTGFHIRINARQQESRPGHYIIQGRRDSRHELRVRIAGEGWSPSVTGGQEGMVSYGQREQGVFDVVADGRQRVEADKYIYSVTGECL